MFIKGAEGTILPAAVKHFPVPDVLAVVKLVQRNNNNVGAVVEKMTSISTIHPTGNGNRR